MNAAMPPRAPYLLTGLSPVIGNSPRVLILGSFPGRMSLSASEYYGNPRNHFWQIAGAVLGFDPALPYAARVAELMDHGIALWDVVHSCRREGSADLRIHDPVYNDLTGFLLIHPTIRSVALNGTAAGRFWHAATAHAASCPRVTVMVLPSTSPANARLTLAEKVQRWKGIGIR
jgi:TDG/mug DNA glycosylase family protein